MKRERCSHKGCADLNCGDGSGTSFVVHAAVTFRRNNSYSLRWSFMSRKSTYTSLLPAAPDRFRRFFSLTG